MSDTVTPIKIAMANQGVNNAQDVQDILNNPALLTILTQILGPYLREYGHSSAFSSIGAFVVWALAHYGYQATPEVAEALCIGCFVVGSYAWQALSIWLGKRNAPIQPTVKG